MDRRTVLLGSLGFVLPSPSNGEPKQTNQKRFALILANEAYENKALTNILNDARAISRTLQQLGFDVTSGLDQTRSGMFSALRTFRDKLTPGCIALVYYSGHGAQVGGENYLIPVNNRSFEKASDLPDEAMPLGRILDALGKSDGQLNLIILDACRDNPFPGAKSLGGDKGLTVVNRNVTGTVIAFAASPGEVASSNPSGKNSLFTEELLKNLSKPGLRLEDVFMFTRKAVRERSGGKQIPQEYGSLESVVFLAGTSGNVEILEKASRTSIRLELSGVPIGAEVMVNDYVLQGVVYTEEVSAKQKDVVVLVKAAGMKNFVRTITLTRGMLVTLKVTMEPISAPTGTRAIGNKLTDYPALKAYVESLRSIPAGGFQMGGESNYKDAKPLHRVTLSKFRMGATPVTVDMWKEYYTATGREFDSSSIPSWGLIDSHPIVHVSWDFIMGADGTSGYCAWASDVSGIRLTLPTEAQFEYAARGGKDGNLYPWGDTYDTTKLWSTTKTDDNLMKTAPVDRSFQIYRNAYGLTDMVGNVWQWCLDRHGPYSSESQTNPVGPTTSINDVHCLRGCPFYITDLVTAQCSNRYRNVPQYAPTYFGFRLACSS